MSPHAPQQPPLQTLRRLRHLLPVVLLFGIFVTALGPAAQAASPAPSPAAGSNSNATRTTPARATFGVRPGSATGSDGRAYFSYQSGPGGSFQDFVTIVNYGMTPLSLSVYPVDVTNTLDGQLSAGLPTQQLTSAGSWIHLSSPKLIVKVPARTTDAPGETVLPFQLRVPLGATPGDHSAAIVAALTTIGKNPKGENVTLEQRLATRMFIRVSGALNPQLEIDNISASFSQTVNPAGKGSAIVTYRIRNSGNINLGARQAVTVTGLFGSTATASNVPDIPLLIPGSAVEVTVVVDGVLSTFRETATVIATPLVVATSSPVNVFAKSQSVGFWAIPIPTLALILLLLLIGAAGWLRRSHRQSAPTSKEGTRHRANQTREMVR